MGASLVLFETIPSAFTWGEIENVIFKISDTIEGNDFWVKSTESINGTIKNTEGRPFAIGKYIIGSNCYHYSEEEISMIRDYVGFNLKFGLCVEAFCNQEIDHRILGELTLYLAQKFDGLIDFCGHIVNQSDNNMKGKIWEIPYETCAGTVAVYSIADVDFMKDWLSNKNFRMFK